MPEGPTLVILREALREFKGKKVLEVSGNAKIEQQLLLNKTVRDFKTFGKHFLICFTSFTVRIHFLMFGSYSINEQTKADKAVRLKLVFGNGTLYFYTCSIKIIGKNLDEIYDWSADVMNAAWDEKKAKQKLKQYADELICDVLLDQDLFAGVGNIIKNEVLFRVRVHPESRIGAIPSQKRSAIISAASGYSFDFLAWKRKYVLKKNLLVYGKKVCPRCDLPLVKGNIGKRQRRSFYCINCQKKY